MKPLSRDRHQPCFRTDIVSETGGGLERTLYAQGGLEIRTVTDEHGEPWFVAKDVCDVLGTKTKDLPAILDEDERGVDTIDTLGGQQKMAIINESGLYSLILRSRKPEAKASCGRRVVGIASIPRRTGETSDAQKLAFALKEAERVRETDHLDTTQRLKGSDSRHLNVPHRGLTNMWKACGGVDNRKPQKWMRQIDAQKLVITLFERDTSKVDLKSTLTRIEKGRNGGTFAHPVIGLTEALKRKKKVTQDYLFVKASAAHNGDPFAHPNAKPRTRNLRRPRHQGE